MAMASWQRSQPRAARGTCAAPLSAAPTPRPPGRVHALHGSETAGLAWTGRRKIRLRLMYSCPAFWSKAPDKKSFPGDVAAGCRIGDAMVHWQFSLVVRAGLPVSRWNLIFMWFDVFRFSEKLTVHLYSTCTLPLQLFSSNRTRPNLVYCSYNLSSGKWEGNYLTW